MSRRHPAAGQLVVLHMDTLEATNAHAERIIAVTAL
jgi:hypothetical protein